MLRRPPARLGAEGDGEDVSADLYVYVDGPARGGQCCGTNQHGARCLGSATVVVRPRLQLCPSHHEAYQRSIEQIERDKRATKERATRQILESSLTPPPTPADQQTREYLEDTL